MAKRLLIFAMLFVVPRHAFPQVNQPSTPLASPLVDYEQARRERVLRAVRTTMPIVMDGRLDEPAWELAEPASNFIQVQPVHGLPATEQTEVRILYDDGNLYIGAMCYDSHPKEIRISSLEKDFASNSTDLFALVLDTLNDRHSGFSFWTNPAGARRDTQIDLDGERTDAEWDGVWTVATRINDKGWVAEIVIPFKTLRFSGLAQLEFGLNMVRRTRRTNEDSTWTPLPLRITSITRVPFAGTLTGLEGIRQGRNLKLKPFAIASMSEMGAPRTRTGDGDGGFDLKYGFTPKLTLDATFRTDFSQVEADQQQVNLTRFNLFFPEKREFFLENQGIFQVASTPDETANILPFFSRRIGLSETGMPIPMLGGAKLSGRAGEYDIGGIAMRTRADGALPANSFVVGRLRRNVKGTHTIGAIVTSRDSSVSGDYSRLYGADLRLRFFRHKLDIASYLLATDAPGAKGSGQAQLVGAAWRGDRLKWVGQYEKVDPEFRPEVGFVRRAAMRHVDSEVSWTQWKHSNAWMRNWTATGRVDHFADPHGDVETRQESASGGIELQNGARLTLAAENTFERLVAPFAIRPSVVLPAGDYQSLRYTLSGNTDLSRSVSGTVSVSGGEFWDGTSRSITGSLTLKPSYRLSLATTLNTTVATLPAGDFTTTIVGTRVLIGFTTHMFLSSFLQYNATINQFTSNSRFNLIHRPLSDLFIVYNERRDTANQALIDRALIVKFTNLFDF